MGVGALAYTIAYCCENKEIKRKHWIRCGCFTMIFLAVFICMVSVLWPEGRELMRNLIGLKDSGDVYAAAEVFAMEVGCGYSLPDALRNFAAAIRMNGYGR